MSTFEFIGSRPHHQNGDDATTASPQQRPSSSSRSATSTPLREESGRRNRRRCQRASSSAVSSSSSSSPPSYSSVWEEHRRRGGTSSAGRTTSTTTATTTFWSPSPCRPSPHSSSSASSSQYQPQHEHDGGRPPLVEPPQQQPKEEEASEVEVEEQPDHHHDCYRMLDALFDEEEAKERAEVAVPQPEQTHPVTHAALIENGEANILFDAQRHSRRARHRTRVSSPRLLPPPSVEAAESLSYEQASKSYEAAALRAEYERKQHMLRHGFDCMFPPSAVRYQDGEEEDAATFVDASLPPLPTSRGGSTTAAEMDTIKEQHHQVNDEQHDNVVEATTTSTTATTTVTPPQSMIDEGLLPLPLAPPYPFQQHQACNHHQPHRQMKKNNKDNTADADLLRMMKEASRTMRKLAAPGPSSAFPPAARLLSVSNGYYVSNNSNAAATDEEEEAQDQGVVVIRRRPLWRPYFVVVVRFSQRRLNVFFSSFFIPPGALVVTPPCQVEEAKEEEDSQDETRQRFDVGAVIGLEHRQVCAPWSSCSIWPLQNTELRALVERSGLFPSATLPSPNTHRVFSLATDKDKLRHAKATIRGEECLGYVKVLQNRTFPRNILQHPETLATLDLALVTVHSCEFEADGQTCYIFASWKQKAWHSSATLSMSPLVWEVQSMFKVPSVHAIIVRE